MHDCDPRWEWQDDDREVDLDMICSMGQTRAMFWQIMPYTVAFAKVSVTRQ